MKYKSDQFIPNILRIKIINVIIFCAFIALLINSSTTTGYTNSVGIEDGDRADIEYVGTKLSDNTEFDSGVLEDSLVAEGQFIVGFYNGLLGMKVGESKEITVSKDEGYTDPGHNLYDEILIFDVYIQAITYNSRDGSTNLIKAPDDDEGGGTFSNIIKWTTGIGGFFLVVGAGVLLWNSVQSNMVIPKCPHCTSIGRKNISAEGKCKKCGTPSCRGSFAKGCPKCRANSFVPLK